MTDNLESEQRRRGLRRGVVMALLAAVLFGSSAPFAKMLLREASPQLLAGLLYLGSGLGLALVWRLRQGRTRETGLRRRDVPWLVGSIAAGGVTAPLLLMYGLSQTPAASASLLLNLEGALTALLAWIVFRDAFNRRVALGMLAIVAGGAVLSWEGRAMLGGVLGPFAIVGACLAWAIDNNLTQKVSGGDPVQIAMLKGLTAGSVNTALALALGASFPAYSRIGGAFALGFFCYGLSLVLFVLSLRHLGTARTGAYFSVAPFVGALVSLAVFHQSPTVALVVSAVLMGLGVWLNLSERHEHEHVHEALEHEHLHVHDRHHQHAHSPDDPPGEPHAHAHQHEPLVHSHPHYPDLHHRHGHDGVRQAERVRRGTLTGSVLLATSALVTLVASDARHAYRELRPSSVTRSRSGDVIGFWAGTADFRGASLQMTVRFERKQGRLTATLSAPDVMLLDQPLTDVVADTSGAVPRVRFTLADPDGALAYEGSRVADTIAGLAVLPAAAAVREGGARMSWRLVRVAPPDSPPYVARELRIARRDAVLAATLLIPRDRRASHPGILILQGSSTNLRAQYRFYADQFARAGFAVLFFDKRGNGASSGDYRRASYDDLVADARAAFDSLAAQPNVDRRHVGLWGLSQGAFIAPLVAEDSAGRADRRVAFVVAVSAPGMPIAEAAAYQDSLHVAWAGLSPAAAREAAAAHRDLASTLRAGASADRVAAVFRRVADKPWRPLTGLPRTPPSTDELRGWYWYGRTLDPITWWRRLRAPVLLVYGEADELVPARASAERLERALNEGKNPDAKVRIYPGANHVVRLVSSPLAPREAKWDWPRPAPGYLTDVTAWLSVRAGLSPSPPSGRARSATPPLASPRRRSPRSA